MNIPGIIGGGGGGLGGSSTAGMSDQEAAMVKTVSADVSNPIDCNADLNDRCNPQWKAAPPRLSYLEEWALLWEVLSACS